MENKVVVVKMEGEYFVVELDPNKDGQPVMSFRLHLSEIPDEILSAFAAKKAPVA